MNEPRRNFRQDDPMGMGSRRRTQLVDKKQQFRFGVTVAFYAFLILVFFFSLTLYPPLLTLLVGGEDMAMRAYRTAVLQFAGFALQYWWISLIGFLSVGCASVILSHRIFGPMRRMEDILWEKRNRPESEVHCSLRKGDYFHTFSRLLEDVLNKHEKVESSAALTRESTEPTSVRRPATAT